MPILLKSTIFVAGVPKGPTDGTLTYSAAFEAELVNRGVASYVGDNPATGGATPATLNENNEIIANVTPRTGTLTNLLTAVAGGVNEVSYATDWNAAIIHNGVVGGAKILYCKPKRCKIGASTDIIRPTGAPSVLDLNLAIYDPFALFSAGVAGILIPAGATHMRVWAAVTFPSNVTGKRQINVSVDYTTAVAGFGCNAAVAADQTSVTPLTVASPSLIVPAATSICLTAGQTSGASLTIPAANMVLEAEFWRES